MSEVARAGNRKTDGSDGGPLIVPPDGAVLSGTTPSGPNAALKEAPKDGDGIDLLHPCRGRTRILDRQTARVEEVCPDGSPRVKIAICGFASSSRRYLPVHDPTWSIWGLNQLYRHIPRADRWFDIHHNWDREVVPGTDHKGWLARSEMPVYMMHVHPDIPTSVRYPIDIIMSRFGVDYFTSSIAYMVALAIWEIDLAVEAKLAQFKDGPPLKVLETARQLYAECAIAIFGVDLVVAEEYFWQKACAEFWIGQASARGINVVIPPESALLKQQYRYGYDPEPNQLIKLADIVAHQQAIVKQRDERLKELWMLEGVIQADDRWRQVLELRDRGAQVD